MRDINEHTLTEAVIERLDECTDARLKAVLTAMIRHLHAFVREIEPTPQEWLEAIQFLTRTGQMCDDKRQEFILLSDTLGVSMLVDAINHRKPAGATESSVLGPFYVEGAPPARHDADLAPGEGPGVVVSGAVKDLQGQPVAGALLDVWQTAPNGLYHVQDGTQQAFHLCAKVAADEAGRFSFRTLVPVSYPVPTDGPVGALLVKAGRHPYRPAHMHFIVSAPGFKSVVTQLFTEGDRYIDSDVVFGVKRSLIVRIEPASSPGADARMSHDFVLERES